MNMQNQSVTILTSELREILAETFRGGSVTVFDFSPTEAS
jgi:hypothetical protein